MFRITDEERGIKPKEERILKKHGSAADVAAAGLRGHLPWPPRLPGGRIALSSLIIPACALTLLCAAARTLLALRSHFWLDETGTIWVTGGGWLQLPARCAVLPLSFVYAWLALALRQLGASSEWIFRLPSTLAVGLAVWGSFRIARRLWGRTAGWLAAAMFVSLPGVSSASRNARPYGIALLLAVMATWFLLRMLERKSIVAGLGYGVTSGLMIHFHVLFGAAVLAHAVYVAYLFVRRRHLAWAGLLTASAALLLVVVPLIPRTVALAGNPAMHDFAAIPEFEDLPQVFLSSPVRLCLMGAFLCVMLFVPKLELEIGREESVLAASLALIPLAALMAASHLSNSCLWLARYYLSYVIGIALCFGSLAGSLRPRRIAAWMALCLLGMNLFMLIHRAPRNTEGVGDWAAGLAYVDRSTATDHAPVLIRSQYIESDFLPLMPVYDNAAFTQVACYGSKSRLIGLPVSFGPTQARAIDELLEGPLHNARRILMLSVDGPRPVAPYVWYLAGRLGAGVSVREIANFDELKVIELVPSHSLIPSATLQRSREDTVLPHPVNATSMGLPFLDPGWIAKRAEMRQAVPELSVP